VDDDQDVPALGREGSGRGRDQHDAQRVDVVQEDDERVLGEIPAAVRGPADDIDEAAGAEFPGNTMFTGSVTVLRV
jgi:hypothetical protein